MRRQCLRARLHSRALVRLALVAAWAIAAANGISSDASSRLPCQKPGAQQSRTRGGPRKTAHAERAEALEWFMRRLGVTVEGKGGGEQPGQRHGQVARGVRHGSLLSRATGWSRRRLTSSAGQVSPARRMRSTGVRREEGPIRSRQVGAGEGHASGARRRVLEAKAVEITGFTGITWRGWGTSLGWFANFVGGLPEAQREHMLDLLFDPFRGMGLNVVRYIIPAGLNAKYNPFLATLPFQAVPGFKMEKDGPYNWTADPAQRAVLLGAMARGADIAEAVAYSPPWWMTINGNVGGNGDKDNLAPENFGAFVEYITDFVARYQELYNVTFVGLDPFNEPLAGWWKGDGKQEGCNFGYDSILKVLELTRAAVANKNLTDTKVVGIDEWPQRTLQGFHHVPGLGDLIDRLAWHAYQIPTTIKFPDPDLPKKLKIIDELRVQTGKEAWQVEWGPHPDGKDDPSDYELAIVLARSMLETINLSGSAAWCHWQAVTPLQPYFPKAFSPHHGLIRLHYNYTLPFEPIVQKQWYVQQQMSKAFQPGCKILSVSKDVQRSVMVAYYPLLNILAGAVLNEGQDPFTITIQVTNLNLKLLDSKGLTAWLFRTSEAENNTLVSNGVVAPTLKDFKGFEVKERSLLTFYLINVELTKP